MKSMNRINTLLLTFFAVMILSVTVNATAIGPKQNLNNGAVALEFFSVNDDTPTFIEGYIYPMTYTAPESGWYNITADGTMGLILGYSDDVDASFYGDFFTYKNETVTFGKPALSYKDAPYRSGAVCDPVYLDKGEEWTFSIIGKYFGPLFSEKAIFQVNLIRTIPKITGVSVNKSTVRPGDTVIYSIAFDQDMEIWELAGVYINENVYGPDGEDIFTMFSAHPGENKDKFKVTGRTITFSYPVTKEDYNQVLKLDFIRFWNNDNYFLSYANDTYRSWEVVGSIDAGYIPGVPAVKFVTGNCYHNMLTGWFYTEVENGKIYEFCELCDYKKLIGVDPDSCTHSWDSGKVTKAATYETEGVMTYTCTICGETRTSTIPKLVRKKGDIVTIGKVKYKVTSSSTVSYVSATSKSKKLTIPSSVTIDGKKYSITAIASKAFKAKKNITSVTIPKTVITIDAQAFYGCKSLKKITIPASVKKIGKKAFYNCSKLTRIEIKTKKLTNKTVGAGAFDKINSSAIVKVPKSKLEAYKILLKKKGIKGKKQKITK